MVTLKITLTESSLICIPHSLIPQSLFISVLEVIVSTQNKPNMYHQERMGFWRSTGSSEITNYQYTRLQMLLPPPKLLEPNHLNFYSLST
jgi:hypothetical protein